MAAAWDAAGDASVGWGGGRGVGVASTNAKSPETLRTTPAADVAATPGWRGEERTPPAHAPGRRLTREPGVTATEGGGRARGGEWVDGRGRTAGGKSTTMVAESDGGNSGEAIPPSSAAVGKGVVVPVAGWGVVG